MMQGKTKTDRDLQAHGAVTNALVLALILLFAALSIALIVLGAQAYQAISGAAQENARQRATASYLLSRVQAFDAHGAVRTEQMEIGGQETCVLVFSETIDGETFETRLYCADGMLREQTVYEDAPLTDAEDGEAIEALRALDAEISGNLLTLRLTHADGQTQPLHAALHSGGEEQP